MTVLVDDQPLSYDKSWVNHELRYKGLGVALKSDLWNGPYNWRTFRGSEDDVVCYIRLDYYDHIQSEKKYLLSFEAISRARRKLYILENSDF